jgi:hypothetical protein
MEPSQAVPVSPLVNGRSHQDEEAEELLGLDAGFEPPSDFGAAAGFDESLVLSEDFDSDDFAGPSDPVVPARESVR